MRVIEVREFGGPEVLEVRDAPDPAAGPGQVVVGLDAVDTLLVETRIRAGLAKEFFDVRPPYVPGGGGAGVVTAAGPDVDPAWVGRRVVASVQNGAYAEQVAVPLDAVVPVPDGVGQNEAAALLHDGVTALSVFETAEVKAGQTVLVVGATGGMGVLLVQLAHAEGARVAAAARGARKLELARELGADLVLDYSEPGWTDAIRGQADAVFDGVGDRIGLAAFDATADGGTFSAHGATLGGFTATDPTEAARRGVTLRGIMDVQLGTDERTRLLRKALEKAAEGVLDPVIGQTFPLERAADAHTAIENRTVLAKTLLLP
ncbi:zinc-binding dehydrogenase [Actinomadura decatromicini]|uniref:Zinc-binding dehydrogenase n=1 Tax=Actinomadura decatromicini TaxID=2604572 RepID=A0A5D3FAP8_9ACTN|nr:zinc-binding dehydrogenase [Actinomadura decatromicini]TYK46037.1 zinc-binding dehydrogenase [Actinomadura decatromicini]